MRILFLSFFFPPYNDIAAVRTGKTAKYLLAFGHDVRVVSAKGQGVRAVSLAVEIPLDRVVYTTWLNPRWPVEKIYGQWNTPPWRGEDAPHFQSSARGRVLRRIQQLVRTCFYFPDPQIGWFPFGLSQGSRLITSWMPDLIYASAGPATCLLMASALARRHSIPWIAEFRDLWTDGQNYQFPYWRWRLERKLEQRVLSSSVGLVTVSEPLAITLRKRFGKQVAVVLNGFDPGDYPAISKSNPMRGEPVRIVYTGIIYAERQSPAPLFEALARLGPQAEKVRVAFYGAERQLLRNLVSGYGVEPFVEINEPVSHLQALEAQSEADVLLHLLWNDPKQPGVYNAKLFEYFGAHRPILAVGQTENVAADLILQRGAGVALDDPVQIAKQLEWWINTKGQNGTIPALDNSVSAGLSREEQTRNLEAFLFQMLKTSL